MSCKLRLKVKNSCPAYQCPCINSLPFPEFDDRKVIMLQVNKEGKWVDQDKHNLQEWLQNRYSVIGFEVVKGNPDDKLFDYILERKNAFIVMGAYGRNALSRFLKPSHANRLIKTITQPIFICHH